MKKTITRAMFGLVIFLVGIAATGGGTGIIEAKGTLKADAGPDQTVRERSPVLVNFPGRANVDDYSCIWYNQWGHFRADQCNLLFEVNFGRHKPKVGTTRTFTLEVTDSKTGERATDQVIITLGEEPTVTASTASAYPGEKVTVKGAGWVPGGQVSLSLIDGPGWIPLALVDKVPASGRWKATFIAPNEPYAWWLTATQECGVDCSLWVELDFEIKSPK